MSTAPRMWTPLDLIRVSAEYLADHGVENPRLDAELLLAHVLRMDRLRLYLEHERPLVAEELDAYRELIRRRSRREPLQLLVGEVQILDLDFAVRHGVFIPRPETEVLILAARELFADRPPETMVELGLGTGCVGLSLLAFWPQSRLVGFETDPTAADLARENAHRHGVADRLEIRGEDGLAVRWPDCDLAVSNPPYVPEGERERLAPEVRDHDPPAALFAGPDGLGVIRPLIDRAGEALRPGGWIAFEHGSDQEQAVADLLDPAVFEAAACRRDLADRPRVTVARRRP